jgi:excisionase family DNA binding protein
MLNQHHCCGRAGGAGSRPADASAGSLGDPLLTVDEVAAHLKVSRRWVYDLVQRGGVPAVRVGRYLRFRPADVRGLLTARDGDGR